MERCTIIVDTRDRFSPMAKCLKTLMEHTPRSHDLLVVAGGVPEHLRVAWVREFGEHIRFIFRPHFVNQAQARNIGLREARTRLAVVMDDDVYVRPGWLEALVRCQQETGAVMVIPNMLETERKIHTAGNDIYITYEHGKAYGHKHLRYHGMILGERCELKRQPTDYGELHLQLVAVEPTLRLNAYDERILEVGEVDQGLTYAKAGLTMMFEPASVIYYALRSPILADDIKPFAWRWDMRNILQGYRYFEQKWGIDITEHGGFRDFLLKYNSQLGMLPRLFPSMLTLQIDRRIGHLRKAIWLLGAPLRAPQMIAREIRARWLGYYSWQVPVVN